MVIASSATSSDPGRGDAPGSGRVGLFESRDEDDSKRLNELIEKAQTGDRAVLTELRELAGKEPQAWLALGSGHARQRDFEASLAAYETAVKLDAGLASDARLLADVHRALRKPETRDAALNLAEKLGASGADLVYDLWLSLRADPAEKPTAGAVLSRLDRAPLNDAASPALKVALGLNSAKGCAAFKKIMPSAAEHADQRALGKLQPLTQRSGCGFLGLRDCYSCLRSTSQLSTALNRARTQAAPSFASEATTPPPTVAPVPAKAKQSPERKN